MDFHDDIVSHIVLKIIFTAESKLIHFKPIVIMNLIEIHSRTVNPFSFD